MIDIGMRRLARLCASLVIAMLTMVAAFPAQACTYQPAIVICPTGGCVGTAYEAQQRRVNFQIWQADRARFRRAAEAGYANPATDFAVGIAHALVPMVRPGTAIETSCGPMIEEIDPAGYLTRDEAAQWVGRYYGVANELTDDDLPTGMTSVLGQNFQSCSAEYRGRVATTLAAQLPAPQLARVWREIARRGFLNPPATVRSGGFTGARPASLLAFASGRSGPLVLGGPPFAYREHDRRWHERVRAEHSALRAFFARDRDGRAVMAALSAIIAADTAIPDNDAALCPTTWTGLQASIADTRAEFEQRMAGRRRATCR